MLKKNYIRPISSVVTLDMSFVICYSNYYIPIGGPSDSPDAKNGYLDIEDTDGNEDSGITEW